MKTITYGNHTIEVSEMSMTAKEVIRYDGHVVSSKRSMTGSTHLFSVKEETEDVQYEVQVGMRWHGFSAYSIVRRNGKVIYTDR